MPKCSQAPLGGMSFLCACGASYDKRRISPTGGKENMCDIQEIQLQGENFSVQGVPSGLRVSARVDCTEVNIEVRRNPTDPIPLLSVSNVSASGLVGAIPGLPTRAASHTFELVDGQPSIRCGEVLNVTI